MLPVRLVCVRIDRCVCVFRIQRDIAPESGRGEKAWLVLTVSPCGHVNARCVRFTICVLSGLKEFTSPHLRLHSFETKTPEPLFPAPIPNVPFKPCQRVAALRCDRQRPLAPSDDIIAGGPCGPRSLTSPRLGSCRSNEPPAHRPRSQLVNATGCCGREGTYGNTGLSLNVSRPHGRHVALEVERVAW